MLDELETPHRKSSKKSTPQKADHKHEYVVVFMMSRIRRFNGTITDVKYRFDLPPICIDCGHTVKRRWGQKFVELEVDFTEYHRLSKERS
jgi:hypothetical protein